MDYTSCVVGRIIMLLTDIRSGVSIANATAEAISSEVNPHSFALHEVQEQPFVADGLI